LDLLCVLLPASCFAAGLELLSGSAQLVLVVGADIDARMGCNVRMHLQDGGMGASLV
jgi:hypothetical protein